MATALVVWVWLVQFPVPVVHAHAQEAIDPLLTEHLARHHFELRNAISGEAASLHVHFYMPWEFGIPCGDEDSHPEPHGNPLGVCAGPMTDGSLSELAQTFMPWSELPIAFERMLAADTLCTGRPSVIQAFLSPVPKVSVTILLGIYRC